jgi:hypothetical protein
MFKNKNSRSFRFQKRYPAANRSGGTITNILIAGIVIVLIGIGVMSLMKQAGETTQEYAQGMVNTTNKASSIACTSNMSQIFQVLQMYSMTEDKLPESYEDLVSEVGMTQIFHCSEPNAPNYTYIPGQTLSSPADNILLYESVPVHSGKCNVLRVSGRIEMLSPEELQAAIEQTKAHLVR